MAINFMQDFGNYNKNVRSIFLFTILQGLGRGIWMGNVLSAFIFYISGESNTLLGYTSAATGAAMTLVVFPAGVFADKYRRDQLLKLAGIFGIIGTFTIYLANDLSLIIVGLIGWGLFQGLNRPAFESLFADSVESGNRSHIYAKLHLFRQLSQSVGPFINILLFYILGDEWEIDDLKTVMTIGIVISSISIYFLYKMSDDYSIPDGISIYDKTTTNKIDEREYEKTNRERNLITFIIIGSNLLVGFGAGMTIKFFPIFLINIYEAKPILVNFLFGMTFVFTGLASVWAQKFSKKNGRIIMMVIVQLLATACLFWISFYPSIILLSILYIVRGSLMNASQPLSRSILMDIISKSNRGKVNSIEALAWGLFWNVSAALGGVLIDHYSFDTTFRITAVIYVCATLPLSLLHPLVKSEKSV